MSADFDVVLAESVDQQEVRRFLSETTNFDVTSSGRSDGGISVTDSDHWQIDAYGPYMVEAEDLGDWVAHTVVQPKWLFQIHVEADSTKQPYIVARKLAEFLADKGRGAAYNPELNEVFHPPSKRCRPKPVKKKEEIIDVVKLEFMLPFDSVTAETASQLLHILRTYSPEAVPIRFGTFEPFQGRLLSGNDDPFLELWNSEMEKESSSSTLAWDSALPWFGGNISFSSRRNDFGIYPPVRIARRHILSLSLDGRVLENDDRCCQSFIKLFQELATQLGAFYAAAHVVSKVSLVGRTYFHTDKTIDSYLYTGPWWQGLPSAPTWLAWFGEPYEEQVASGLLESGYAKRAEQNAIFLCMTDKPKNAGQLKSIFPELPKSLVQADPYGPAAEIIPFEEKR